MIISARCEMAKTTVGRKKVRKRLSLKKRTVPGGGKKHSGRRVREVPVIRERPWNEPP